MEKNEMDSLLNQYLVNAEYDYDVDIVYDKIFSGKVDVDELNNSLISHSQNGWRLKFAFTDELGKNMAGGAVGALAAGLNSTQEQIVLIYERNRDYAKKKLIQKVEDKDIPVINYSNNSLLRPGMANVYFSPQSRSLFIRLICGNYTGRSISSIKTKIIIETDFGDKLSFDCVYFTEIESLSGNKGYIQTEYSDLVSDKDIVKIVKSCQVEIIGYVTADGKSYDDTNQTFHICKDPNTVSALKHRNGFDAFEEYCDLGANGWQCICGHICAPENEICEICGRKKGEDGSNLGAILAHAEELKSAKEIYTYLTETSGLNISDSILEKMHKMVVTERLYGNMKDEAIQLLSEK